MKGERRHLVHLVTCTWYRYNVSLRVSVSPGHLHLTLALGQPGHTDWLPILTWYLAWHLIPDTSNWHLVLDIVLDTWSTGLHTLVTVTVTSDLPFMARLPSIKEMPGNLYSRLWSLWKWRQVGYFRMVGRRPPKCVNCILSFVSLQTDPITGRAYGAGDRNRHRCPNKVGSATVTTS